MNEDRSGASREKPRPLTEPSDQGSQPASRATLLRAFLFTDLVGSTALTAHLGVEAAERFRRSHFSMLRVQLDRFGGVEVKSVGDGVMVVFESVHRALDAAAAMQMAVQRAGAVGAHHVSMRVGVSVGDAVPHRGDFYGLAVNQAARLCNAAAGGDVLVSQTVTLIAAPTEHRFVDRGLEQLRGLPEAIGVFELDWPRERSQIEFPLPARVSAGMPFRFVGRQGAQAHLADALEAARKGQRQLVFVSGEPGIGKTSLVTEVTRTVAHAAELIVLYGACDEDLARPYGPFAVALQHVADTATVELLDELRPAIQPALFRLVPALAARLGQPAVEADTREIERAELFDAVTALLRRLGDQCPVALVLDDLHWADNATLALLRHLARQTDLPLAMIGTYRDSEIDAAHPLSDTLGVVARLERVRSLRLGGFDDDEVCELVGAAAGHQLDTSARHFALAVGREAAGNPYFIVEILRDLAERGAVTRNASGVWSTEPNWQISLPRTVRDVIVQRVQRLGNPVMRSLSAAAVLGLEFDPLLVAEVVGAAVDDVVEAMDMAAAAAMVAESPTVSGWLTFSHGLAQRTLYEQLGLLRRQQLHRLVAECLEGQVLAHPGRTATLAAGLARHWLASGRVESLPKAFHWSLEAGRAALDGVGAEEAEHWLEQALELLGRLPDAGPTQRAQALLLLGIAQRQAGNPAFRETLLEAASVAHADQQPELLVAAVLANSRGIQSSTGGGDHARLAMLDVAIEVSRGGKPADRARLLALSALERLHVATFQERLALVDQALALARTSGDEATLAYVLTVSHNAIRVPETLSRRLADTAEAITLADRGPDLLARFWAAEHRARAASEVPDLHEVDRVLQRCQELAERLNQPGLRYYLAMHASWRQLLAGDLAGAEEAAAQVRIIGKATGQPETDSMFVAQLLAIRREQGRQGELEGLLIKALQDNPGIAALRSSVSLLHASAGRLEEAAATFAADARSDFTQMPYNTLWSTALVQYTDVAAVLGDRAAAATLLERLSPFAGTMAHNSATCAGPIDRALGVLAAMVGQHERATGYFGAALACCETAEAPLWAARTLLGWVRHLPQPAAEAEARLHRALELAEASDAAGVREEALRCEVWSMRS